MSSDTEQADRRRPMAAPLLELRRPSTSANSARCWSSARRRWWWSMKMAGCCSTTRGCAKFLDTARTSSIFATPVRFGTTSISARGSSNQLRDRGGQVLNEKVIWRTKNGTLVHLLLSYVQVAYHGGHISFVGGKRVLWVYDITALTQHEAQVAEQERQLREILDYLSGRGVRRRRGRAAPVPQLAAARLDSATRRRNWIYSTPSDSGTTSLTGRASSNCCGRAAANC